MWPKCNVLYIPGIGFDGDCNPATAGQCLGTLICNSTSDRCACPTTDYHSGNNHCETSKLVDTSVTLSNKEKIF